MVDVFVRRLRELNDKEKGQLVSEFNSSPGQMLVRTTFDLPPAQRDSIEGAVKETLGKEAQIRFETAPDLISGIELTVNGQKVAWSIEDYLESLEKGVDELLKEQSKPETRARPEPEPDEPEPKPEPESEKEIKTESKPQQRASEHGT